MTALLVIGAVSLACSPVGPPAERKAYAELIDAQGNPAAHAEFTETDAGVRMQLKVENLPENSYTVQIHEIGVCEAPDFLSAGEPYPPPEEIAMAESVAGPQNRSTARFHADNGVAEVEAVVPVVTLGAGGNSLFHPGGTSLVIDEVSSAGTYGGRVACGVITPTPQHRVGGSPQGDIESARQPDNLGTPGKEYQRPTTK
jgi:Cu-Zn family superoxide dismutase